MAILLDLLTWGQSVQQNVVTSVDADLLVVIDYANRSS